MATVYGVNAAKGQTSPKTAVDPSDYGGKLRVIYDKYTFTADLAAADVIKLGQIPAGARVVGGYLNTSVLDASGGTLDLGWAASADAVEAADDDGFAANLDVTGALKTNLMTASLAGIGKKFSSACDLQAKIEGDTDTTTGTIEVFLYYTVD